MRDSGVRVIPCPKCENGWLQYLINRDVYKCAKCEHEEPWSEELNKRFNDAASSDKHEQAICSSVGQLASISANIKAAKELRVPHP